MKTSTFFSLFTSVLYYSVSIAQAQDTAEPANITDVVVDNAAAGMRDFYAYRYHSPADPTPSDGIDLFSLDASIINGALAEMEAVYEQVATVEGETATDRKRSFRFDRRADRTDIIDVHGTYSNIP